MISSRRRAPLALALGLSLAIAGAARADDAPAPEDRDLDAGKVKSAIERGVAWLKKQQRPDGRYDDGYMAEYPLGPTALAALTMLKCCGPNDPAALKALAALDPKELKKTYDVGLVLMAIEARYAPKHDDLAASDYTYVQLLRKAFSGGAPVLQKCVTQGVDFLAKTQKEVWAYPMPDFQDHSNTQYALLGIAAARRMSIEPPIAGLQRALEHFLRVQEKDGPAFDAFTVPAADHTVKECEALNVALHKPKVRASGGTTEVREFWETSTREKMRARGFAYRWEETTSDKPGEKPGNGQGGGPGGGGGGRGGGGWGRGGARWTEANVSMTTAGLACLVTLKWALEGTPGYKQKETNQAIRDAAAYIARNWEPGQSEEHEYYILYGIERAGAMTGCPLFGKKDWYVDGGEFILEHQSDDGSWGKAGPVSGRGASETSLPDTCFALLFLKKGSVPVVPPIPKRIATGDSGGARAEEGSK